MREKQIVKEEEEKKAVDHLVKINLNWKKISTYVIDACKIY